MGAEDRPEPRPPPPREQSLRKPFLNRRFYFQKN